ncbi:MAG: imidazoleglycerol-phosphate dehydratase [Hirschia sp.]|nr:imidazoleglycerol-phosphate dehydratase [Hirschia sp.]MBF18906.1 imidazoleglycerol-phosphate dehydratase [Hirschia sp.]|tara:strand:- start:72 stop:683 length:612 start_codon:yes stop_codon:yes gene_type:complete
MAKSARSAEKSRETKETQIKVRVDVDGVGASNISTGIGFFDHMLESLAKHSSIDMDIECKGDLHIDFHHTMEDVGIVLGVAIREALTGKSGGFSGIQRFGHAYIPMDETLARATMDLCNRPYLIWRVDFTRDKVGDVDTELFKEFFHAFAMNSGTCLHVECLYGVNSHHIAEACFKALARALRMAVSPDERLKGQAASTKGAL